MLSLIGSLTCFEEVEYSSELLENSNTNTIIPGILAEEMGLGKTVEMIALISLHKRPLDAFETKAVSSGELPPSSATLIITPPSILLQWISELQRHSPTLKVFHYRGIKSYPELDHTQLLDKLSNHDVVFTTYNVLSSEIHYSLPTPDRQLRAEKRYVPLRSPLTQLLWWRVCLDEAQMIENGVSNAATVAKLIPRVFSWAVTGTPVQRDLAGMSCALSLAAVFTGHRLEGIGAKLIENRPPRFTRFSPVGAFRLHASLLVVACLATPELISCYLQKARAKAYQAICP
jgi:hypothetical protein